MTKAMDSDLARASELDEVDRDIRQRIELKEMLVAELLAGCTSLATVTAQFLVLNQERARDMVVIRRQFSGASDTEKTARNVIGYAELQIKDCGDIHRALIFARLECELRQITARESQ
jgi:N-acetylmuramic acid 6-phosphate (MurNAc-6-P) etherase